LYIQLCGKKISARGALVAHLPAPGIQADSLAGLVAPTVTTLLDTAGSALTGPPH
jgi:hypothetical protein